MPATTTQIEQISKVKQSSEIELLIGNTIIVEGIKGITALSSLIENILERDERVPPELLKTLEGLARIVSVAIDHSLPTIENSDQ